MRFTFEDAPAGQGVSIEQRSPKQGFYSIKTTDRRGRRVAEVIDLFAFGRSPAEVLNSFFKIRDIPVTAHED